MDNRSSKLFTVLILIISCQLFGTSLSASVFGINFGSLKNTAQNRIENAVSELFHLPKQHSVVNNPTAYSDNRKVSDNGRISFPIVTNTWNPMRNENLQDTSLTNQQYNQNNFGMTDYSENKNAHTQNKNLQGYSIAPDTSNVTPGKILNYGDNLAPVKIDSRGSYASEDNSKPYQYNADEKKNPDNEIISEYKTVSSVTDITTDYPTETSDYDYTTTDEPLNRIGAPPAVVASLLG